MSRTYYFSSSLVLIFSTYDFVVLFDDFNDFMSLYPLDKLYGYTNDHSHFDLLKVKLIRLIQ